MKTAKKMTATNLRIILSVAIFLTASVSVGGFILLTGSLKDYANEVSKINGEAQASDTNIQSLQKTQAELTKYKDAAKRAQSIVSESASYQYQDQITRDLNNYAEQAGIAITGFTFDSAAAATAPATSGTGATPAPQAAAAPTGVNSKTVTIQLESSVPYKSLLTFMNMIEQNLTKMQIAKVTLAKSGDNDENVAGQTLAIEVYVK